MAFTDVSGGSAVNTSLETGGNLDKIVTLLTTLVANQTRQLVLENEIIRELRLLSTLTVSGLGIEMQYPSLDNLRSETLSIDITEQE